MFMILRAVHPASARPPRRRLPQPVGLRNVSARPALPIFFAIQLRCTTPWGRLERRVNGPAKPTCFGMYLMGYTDRMREIRRTEEFSDWLRALRDGRGKAKILVRIERLAGGNPGDVRPVV